MATKKPKALSESDYVIPEGGEWVTPPCSGSVGSALNLVDVQKQVQENENAFRENRKAQALAIPCPFCKQYHLEMQSPVATLIGGEAIKDFIDVSPPPVEEPPVDEVALNAGIVAVHNPDKLPEEEDDDVNSFIETLGDDDGTGTSESNSNS